MTLRRGVQNRPTCCFLQQVFKKSSIKGHVKKKIIYLLLLYSTDDLQQPEVYRSNLELVSQEVLTPKIIILRYCNPEDLKMQDTLLNKNTKPIRVTT